MYLLWNYPASFLIQKRLYPTSWTRNIWSKNDEAENLEKSGCNYLITRIPSCQKRNARVFVDTPMDFVPEGGAREHVGGRDLPFARHWSAQGIIRPLLATIAKGNLNWSLWEALHLGQMKSMRGLAPLTNEVYERPCTSDKWSLWEALHLGQMKSVRGLAPRTNEVYERPCTSDKWSLWEALHLGQMKSMRGLAPRTSEASWLQSNSRQCHRSELVMLASNMGPLCAGYYRAGAQYIIG